MTALAVPSFLGSVPMALVGLVPSDALSTLVRIHAPKPAVVLAVVASADASLDAWLRSISDSTSLLSARLANAAWCAKASATPARFTLA